MESSDVQDERCTADHCVTASIQFLYRMKTSKQFEKVKHRDSDDEDLLAIQHIYLDEESRLLALGGAHHILLYSYSKKETSSEMPVSVENTGFLDSCTESHFLMKCHTLK